MIERRVSKTTLDNGLVVLTEPIPHVRSVSLGVWIRAGSRHELTWQNGITHFIEHALFKGTRRRNARQIAVEADIIGGNLDAFTTRELTGYYIKSLDSHLNQSFDLLADLIINPLFDPAEMEKERDVILEEIKMVDDTPDEMVEEMFVASCWPDHPLGRPIEGTTESVRSFSRDTLVDYYQQIYHPKNIVLAAAGNIEHEQMLELTHRYFGDLKSNRELPSETAPRTQVDLVMKKKRGLEQTHIVMGAACPTALSPKRYICSVFNTILGGGLSSRLFQSVRETHGLAYSVYSGIDSYRDAGCLSIYLAVSNRRVRKAIDLVLAEIRKLKAELVSAEELRATKDQIKTAILLNLDSVTSRMNSLAQNEIIYHRDFSLDEIIGEIERVSAQEVCQLAREIFTPEGLILTMLGASDRHKLDRQHLTC